MEFDFRSLALALVGDLWRISLLAAAFAATMRQAFGVWDDARPPWGPARWVAAPLAVAGIGVVSATLLLLLIPYAPPADASPRTLGMVLSACVAPVGSGLQLAAALLLATAPMAWWRGHEVARRDAVHTVVACVGLGAILVFLAAEVDLQRAALAYAGALQPDRMAQFADLHHQADVAGELARIAMLAVAGAGLLSAWWEPELRGAWRRLGGMAIAVLIFTACVHLAFALRTEVWLLGAG